MESINIIFPNQLFENSVLINNGNKTFLIEEILFFKQFNFHKTKLYFHRISMKKYHDYLLSRGVESVYVSSNEKNSDY